MVAFWGIPGYTSKGIYKELQKRFGSSVQNYIIAARTAQGYVEMQRSTIEDRAEIVSKWQAAQVDSIKRSSKASGSQQGPGTRLSSTSSKSKSTVASAEPLASDKLNNAGEASMEEAIEASVEATSRGNTEEDAMIERAIRASIAELQGLPHELDDDEAFRQAVETSMADARSGYARTDRRAKGLWGTEQTTSPRNGGGSGKESTSYLTVTDDPNIHSDDDENIRTAIKNSRLVAPNTSTDTAIVIAKDHDDIEAALEASRQHEADQAKKSKMESSEEEIVMNYVIKQSLLEEELRRKGNG